jgi:hypothetical protein
MKAHVLEPATSQKCDVTSWPDLYCWSMWAFSIRLSLARLFWNHILICVSVSASVSASSNRLLREMYSLRWYSSSSRNVCSLLNVVLCLRGLPSFLRRLATETTIRIEICALLRFYAAWNSNFLPTFRDKLSVPSSKVKQWLLEMGPIVTTRL